MNRKTIYATALAAGLALIFAGGAQGAREVVRAGNLVFADNGGISPTVLPKHGKAPITAHIRGEIDTSDGSHPPALRTLDAEVDKTIEIDAVGLPACKLGQITASDSATAKRVCGDAIIGSGSAEVEVAFEEQPPFSATGPVVLFNGGVKGRTTSVLIHAYVAVPAPTAIVTRATVTRIDDGRYGLRIQAAIPRIAGGAGSPTKFDLKIGRRFTYKGERKSLLTASCPTGSWLTRGTVGFADETTLSVSHLFPCTAAG